MKASELRIGNWVYAPFLKKERIIDCLDIRDQFEGRLFKPFEPIPLTSEWLERFGFVDDKNVGVWFGPKYPGTEIRFHVWDWFGDKPYRFTRTLPDDVIDIHHVHQLQNLYFALTGEELTIKDDGKKEGKEQQESGRAESQDKDSLE